MYEARSLKNSDGSIRIWISFIFSDNFIRFHCLPGGIYKALYLQAFYCTFHWRRLVQVSWVIVVHYTLSVVGTLNGIFLSKFDVKHILNCRYFIHFLLKPTSLLVELRYVNNANMSYIWRLSLGIWFYKKPNNLVNLIVGIETICFHFGW